MNIQQQVSELSYFVKNLQYMDELHEMIMKSDLLTTDMKNSLVNKHNKDRTHRINNFRSTNQMVML